MPERLCPPLSIYSRPLVIYYSPLIICSYCLLDALRTCLYKCFINMTIYLVSFSAYFATIFSSGLRVLFLDMFIQIIFCCKYLRTCYTHNFFHFIGILCSLCDIFLLNVFFILLLIKIKHTLIVNFNGPFITDFYLFRTRYFHVFFLLKSAFSRFFFRIYSFFLTTMFNIIFVCAFTTGRFPCFINVLVCYLCISDHFASIISQEISVNFRDKLFNPIIHCQCLITCHTQRLFLLKVLAAVISQTSSASSMPLCCPSTFNLSSVCTSMDFS